jgi:hypothetical protein
MTWRLQSEQQEIAGLVGAAEQKPNKEILK